MSFAATLDLNDAMLVGGVSALLDAHPTLPAYANIFDGTAVLLVTLVFARPAATLVSHALVFHQGDPTGDFIVTQGNAAAFALYNGANVLLGTGDVTDMAGSGGLKVSGTTGTLLYAGARAILGELKFV